MKCLRRNFENAYGTQCSRSTHRLFEMRAAVIQKLTTWLRATRRLILPAIVATTLQPQLPICIIQFIMVASSLIAACAKVLPSPSRCVQALNAMCPDTNLIGRMSCSSADNNKFLNSNFSTQCHRLHFLWRKSSWKLNNFIACTLTIEHVFGCSIVHRWFEAGIEKAHFDRYFSRSTLKTYNTRFASIFQFCSNEVFLWYSFGLSHGEPLFIEFVT